MDLILAFLLGALVAGLGMGAWLWRRRRAHGAPKEPPVEVVPVPSRMETAAESPGNEGDYLEDLLNAVPVPLWLRDGGDEVVFVNRAAAADPPEDRPGVRVTEIPLANWPGAVGLALPAVEEAHDGDPGGDQGADPQMDVSERLEILENLSLAVAVFGSDTRCRYANGAFCRLWGLEPDWLIGGPDVGAVLDRLRETRRLPEVADFKAFKEEQRALFETVSAPVEEMMHLPDGRMLHRVVGPDRAGGLVFFFEDVTDRLDLERAVNRLTAVQRETIDNLHEGVAVFGGDGRLKLGNPAFAAIWGLAEADLASNLRVADFVDRTRPFTPEVDDWAGHRDRVVARLMDRAPSAGRLARGDGTVVDYANVPLPDGGVLLSYLDVTDGARVERALRERAAALREADRLKTDFVAQVSFELRKPLTNIVGFAEMLAAEYFGELNRRQMEYAQHILDSARLVMSTLGDILDLARVDAGLMTLELDTVDLHDALAAVLALVKERAAEKAIELDFDCPPDIGWVVADARRLKQSLLALLGGAVRTVPDRSKLHLAARREGDEALIAIGGPGFRLPTGNAEGADETDDGGDLPPVGGLGLALARRFVELHGGRVQVETGPRKGTTVTCRLPAGTDPAAPVPP